MELLLTSDNKDGLQKGVLDGGACLGCGGGGVGLEVVGDNLASLCTLPRVAGLRGVSLRSELPSWHRACSSGPEARGI